MSYDKRYLRRFLEYGSKGTVLPLFSLNNVNLLRSETIEAIDSLIHVP